MRHARGLDEVYGLIRNCACTQIDQNPASNCSIPNQYQHIKPTYLTSDDKEDDDGDDDDGNDLDMCIFQRYHIQRNQTAVDLNARNILYICSCVRCVRGTVSVCERVSCVLVCMCVCVCARRCLCVCMDDESTAHLVGDGCDG